MTIVANDKIAKLEADAPDYSECGWELWWAWRPVLPGWLIWVERRRWNGKWEYRRKIDFKVHLLK